MTRNFIYSGSYPFRYYLISILTNEPYLVSENEFFKVVGYDRRLIPMYYDKNNINRQNFYLDGMIIAYRER